MAVMELVRRALALGCASLIALGPAVTTAAPGECHVVDFELQPQSRPDLAPGKNQPPQIVAWVEDAAGVYVDTIFITKETGSHGLGNRPGRFDFNSGPLWPYGRRTTVFPVWAHRHGLRFPEVIFQNADDSNLSHPFNQSSREVHYCRPMQPLEPAWDALTCASPTSVYTDKGMLGTPDASRYPPRQDITMAPGTDHASVAMFAELNPFDAVSQATPTVDQLAALSWPIPEDLPKGSYVLWIEVSKEFDHNDTYSVSRYPALSGFEIPWSEYGEPYRGQPSVIYQVPFTIGATVTTAQTSDYVGYGDPDGLDGNLRAPDTTITTNVQGSGAARLALVPDGSGGMFRVRVTSRPEFDDVLPGVPAQVAMTRATSQSAEISFVAPGDDGTVGVVAGYDIRYRIGSDITEQNFFDPRSIDPKPGLPVVAPGTVQTFTLDRLLPETDYSVAIRAFDDCHNTSALSVIRFRTAERPIGEVDACFVATAAYGSVLAADVELLRHLRDAVIKKSVLGELAIEAYYTFGPAVAGVVGESELLRETARGVLAPIVRWVRGFRI